MEKIKKTVKIGQTVYAVKVKENGEIEASETVYPTPGYGNNYGTSYTVYPPSKKWARTQVWCWNSTYGTRGHGLSDSWTQDQGFIEASEAAKFLEEITKKLQDAEDTTPDIKAIFDEIRAKVQTENESGGSEEENY